LVGHLVSTNARDGVITRYCRKVIPSVCTDIIFWNAVLYGYLNRLQSMGIRRQTVEHPFGTLKAWMGSIQILGVGPLIQAIRA